MQYYNVNFTNFLKFSGQFKFSIKIKIVCIQQIVRKVIKI